MNIDPKALDAKALGSYTEHVGEVTNTVGFLLKIVPTTIFDAFAKGDILQVLVIALLFGAGLSLLGERGKPLVHFIELATDVLFKVIGFIVRLAPLGVLGAVAFTVGKYGVGSLKQLGYLVALFYAGVAIFVVVVLGAIMRLVGFSIFKFLAYLREELMVVLGTASSDSVLPQIMRKLEALGIKDSTVGLVIPTGYSFNLDAFSLYLTLAAVFIAQATNTSLAMGDLLVDHRHLAVDFEGRARRPWLGHRRARRDPFGGPGHPGHRVGPRALGRLVHGHRPRARQPDRQLRRDGRGRGLGGRHRPRIERIACSMARSAHRPRSFCKATRA